MKVLLINPPLLSRFRSYPVPPLGIAHLASSIRDRHETRIMDLNVEPRSKKAILREIKRFAPQIIGMSSTTPTYYYLKELAGEIKKRTDAKIVFGGNHSTALPREVVKCESIDFVIKGEADRSFSEFLTEYESGSAKYSTPGLYYKNARGEIIANPVGPLIEDLNSLPLPAWDLLPMNRYRGRLRYFFSTMFSRGCPFSCTYCAAHLTHGKKVRRRSLDHIMEELRTLESKYAVSFLVIFDDTFTSDRDFVIAFCKRKIAESIEMEFWCNTRVNLVDRELLQLMKRAGCAVISYGVESNSDQTLKEIKKGTTVEQAREAVALTREAGIIPEGFIMVNFPGETEEDMNRTIDFAFELKLPFFEVASAIPYPGTEYALSCRQNGLIPVHSEIDFSRYWVVDDVVVDNGSVQPERVRSLMARARRRMIFRPIFWRVVLRYFLLGARPVLADLPYYLAYLPRLALEFIRAK
jgi:radical SAM superfamily enzyme YgiQ (UPF0313 family)